MISGLKKVGLALAVLFVLKFLAAGITASSPYFTKVIEDQLDPSQMFYTESKEVLKAEKEVYQKIRGSEIVDD